MMKGIFCRKLNKTTNTVDDGVFIPSQATGNLRQNRPSFVEKTIKRQKRFLELLKEGTLLKRFTRRA